MLLGPISLFILIHWLPRAKAGSGSRQWFTERALLPLKSYKIDIVFCGTTVAELGYTRTGKLEACRLSETRDNVEMQWLIGRLSHFARRTHIEEMLRLIELCGRLETSQVLRNETHLRTYPGTLWCGPGDSASSYQQLGYNFEVDRCCRNHDLCPVRASPGEIIVPFIWGQGSGRSSLNIFTVSHCRCDVAFKRCLHEAGSSARVTSRALIFVYEMVMRQCLGDNGQLVSQHVDLWDFV